MMICSRNVFLKYQLKFVYIERRLPSFPKNYIFTKISPVWKIWNVALSHLIVVWFWMKRSFRVLNGLIVHHLRLQKYCENQICCTDSTNRFWQKLSADYRLPRSVFSNAQRTAFSKIVIITLSPNEHANWKRLVSCCHVLCVHAFWYLHALSSEYLITRTFHLVDRS